MSDKIALFTGSFDPVTNGHMDLIKRSAKLFDTVYVGVFYNKGKQGFFPIEERRQMLEVALDGMSNVKVITARDSLAIDIARQLDVTYLVRGLRNARDLEFESNMAFYNKHLAAEIETIFLLTSLELSQLSSSGVRELIHSGTDISDFVPESVVKAVEKRNNNVTKI